MLKSHQKTIFQILGRNPIHPFPARMAPGIALEALGESSSSLRVLDPMSGSGTVLAVARANGHRAFGVDLDPLAVLLARVWTKTIDAHQVRDKAAEVLSRARQGFLTLSEASAYPTGSDEETRKFIHFWFDDNARCQLASLSAAIRRVRDDTTRDVLWCAFSRLIITKKSGASLAMDLSHSRPHKSFETAPVKPFDRFLSALEVVVSNCPQRHSKVGPPAVVKRGDARKLDIASKSIDLVLSSPPYLNAIDYIRCSKFSLVWMGHTIGDLRAVRGSSVGTEVCSSRASDTAWVQTLIRQLRLRPSLAHRDEAMLAQYALGMGESLSEVSRVLRDGGRAVYVVGDSTIRGTFIRNSEIVKAVAEENGLKVKSQQSRKLPENRRYMPPPNKQAAAISAMGGRMRREVVLVFDKC